MPPPMTATPHKDHRDHNKTTGELPPMVSTTRASAVTITDRARTVNAGRTILSCFSSYLRVRISGKLLEGGIRDISHIVGATLVKPGNQVAGTHLFSSSEFFIVLCMAEVSGPVG